MVWVKAEYEFGSLFSYRIPDYPSPSYALSSPLPGPSTIKLAIVATAIETSGKVDVGEKIFEILKGAEIKIKIPEKIALSNMLIKRLKKKKEKMELESTFGIRGYVHLSEPLIIYIAVDNKDSIKESLKKIRYFGTSDSLVYCKNDVTEEEPPANCIEPLKTLEKVQRNVLVMPVKDLKTDSRFENVNPYLKPIKTNVSGDCEYCEKKDVKIWAFGSRKVCKECTSKAALVKKFYLLPIFKQTQGKNWVIYETS
jgi:CRISPR-associated Cas5-like protein